jgi:hypothetical protein
MFPLMSTLQQIVDPTIRPDKALLCNGIRINKLMSTS